MPKSAAKKAAAKKTARPKAPLPGASKPGGARKPLTDKTVGPLLKAWLLVVTNQAFWDKRKKKLPTEADLLSYAKGVGVDPDTLKLVQDSTTGFENHFAAVNEKFRLFASDAGYVGDVCPTTASVIPKVLK